MGGRFSNTEEFIEKATKIHGAKYNYNKVDYKASETPVTITCLVHGDFDQVPHTHLRGKGCPQCGLEKKTSNKEDFINKVSIIHNKKYSYDKVEYKKATTKVIITCPIHGDFEQLPAAHIQGQGCPQCAVDLRREIISITKDDFLEKANITHNNYYNYDKVNYINNNTSITITCPKHGDFTQIPRRHLAGNRCPQCGLESSRKLISSTTEEFIDKAKKVHLDKYDYSKVYYKHNNSKVIIECPIHGEFKQTPANHLAGHGCHTCKMSHGERLIEKALKIAEIPYVTQHRLSGALSPERQITVDFFIPTLGCIIEFHGSQHFEFTPYFHGNVERYLEKLERDAYLKYICDSNGLKYLEFNYKELKDLSEDMFKQIVISRLSTIKRYRAFNTKFNRLYTLCQKELEQFDFDKNIDD